jgi:hypothetical protein
MFQTVGQNAEAKCLHFGDRVVPGLPIDEHARDLSDLGDPPSVFFVIQGDRQADSSAPCNHAIPSKNAIARSASTITILPESCRVYGCLSRFKPPGN